MTIHLRVKYLIIFALALFALCISIRCSAKAIEDKAQTHKASVHVSQAPVQGTVPVVHLTVVNKPVTTAVAKTVTSHAQAPFNGIVHNADASIDAITGTLLEVPKGYVIEQVWYRTTHEMYVRSIIHADKPRILVRNEDGTVLAVCYKPK